MTGALRRIIVMAVTTIRRMFNSPSDVMWMLVMPVLFSLMVTSLFGGGAGSMPTVYVVNEDGTAFARSFIDELAAGNVAVRELERDEAVAALAETRNALAIVLPARFADAVAAGGPTLEFLRSGSSDADVVLREIETRAKTVAHALATGETVPSIHVVHEVPQTGAGGRALSNVRATFGIYLVFAFSALFGRGVALHNEYKDGTLQRIVAGGVAYGEVVAGHVLTIFLIGAVQAAVVLTVTGFLGTLWLTAGWGVLVVTLLGTVFVTSGLAICLSGLVRSTMLIGWLTGGVPTLLAMTGGAFFPLEAAPLALQKVARINPVYWVMELFEEGYVYEGVAGQLWPLSVLLLIGMLGAVIGIQGLRRVEL